MTVREQIEPVLEKIVRNGQFIERLEELLKKRQARALELCVELDKTMAEMKLRMPVMGLRV